MTAPGDIDALISRSVSARRRGEQRRGRWALAVSLSITVVWLVAVTVFGQWGRVLENWAAAVTMVFGSFVAGSTPQGGGAVAFPVFTKLLDVPTEIARSFSLLIQTVGMGAAAAAILLRRRPVVTSALTSVVPAAVVGFAGATLLLTDSASAFRTSIVPGPYVKVSFTVVLAAMAAVVFLSYRSPILMRQNTIPPIAGRIRLVLVLSGLVGGLASALVGSGADVATYIGVVILLGVNPRVGVPTSVIVMASVSAVGFVWFGLMERQLFAAPLGSVDLAGLWLAAVPVVAWGAPLGSWVASRVSDRQLVSFVVLLALAEVLSTVLFLEPLRTDPALAVFGLVALVGSVGGLVLLVRHRAAIIGLPAIDPGVALTRSQLDVAGDFREGLKGR